MSSQAGHPRHTGARAKRNKARVIVGKSLNVRNGWRSRLDDMLADYEKTDFTVFTELGYRLREVPPEVRAALKARDMQDHHVWVNGSATTSNHSVMVLVNGNHTPIKDSVRYHRSGRAMTVDIALGGTDTRIRVIGAYQPTGLDRAPTDDACTTQAKHNEARAVAEDIRDAVRTWRDRPGVDRVFLMGDLNETYDGAVDRIRISTSGTQVRGEYRPGSTIANMIEADGWVDMFRHTHPSGQGFTWSDKRGRKARLDYALTYPAIPERAHARAGSTRAEGADFTLTSCEPSKDQATKSDHVLIRFEASIKGGTHRHPGRDTSGEPWAPEKILTLLATPEDRERCAMEADNRVRGVLQTEKKKLSACTNGDHRTVIESTLDTMHTIMLESAKAHLGWKAEATPDGQRTRKRTHQSRTITYLRSVRRQVVRLRTQLRLAAENGTDKTGKWSLAARRAAYSANQLAQTMVPATILESQSARSTWLGEVPNILRSIRKRGRDELKKVPNHSRWLKDRLFSSPHGRRAWYKRYFEFTRPCSIRSAADPKTKARSADPCKYMPIVRDLVARPFRDKHDRPGLPGWRKWTEKEELTGKPDWWDQYYGRDRKGCGDAFKDVCKEATPEEIWKTVRDAGAHKTPGHDGISIDLLKILLRTDRKTMPDSPTLHLLTSYVNAAIRSGVVATALKRGIIVMIPKSKGAADVTQMRPLTLLPETGKLCTRLIARRFTRIFTDNPGLLNGSQRAFQEDGCIRQCIDAILTAFEDHKGRKDEGGTTRERKTKPPCGSAPRRQASIAVVSYDQRKAFDKVQLFSIIESLRRFNVPERCIRFIADSLTGATSQVRTHAGLTKDIDLNSGVRQGDPLSPLLYIIVTDALLEGYNKNPLYPDEELAYVTRRGDRITAAGYADDVCVVAPTFEQIRKQHDWTREFYAAHHFQLNCTKTVLSLDDGEAPQTEEEWANRRAAHRHLPPVTSVRMEGHGAAGDPKPWCAQRRAESDCDDQADAAAARKWSALWRSTREDKRTDLVATGAVGVIVARDPTFVFRYLGLHICVALRWDHAITALEKSIWSFNRICIAHRLSMVQVATAAREKLYPALELKLQYARPSEQMCKRWDNIIWTACSYTTRRQGTNRITIPARLLVTGMAPLFEYARMVRVTEVAVRMVTTTCPSADFVRREVEGMVVYEHGPEGVQTADLRPRARRVKRKTMLWHALKDMHTLGMSFSCNPTATRVPQASVQRCTPSRPAVGPGIARVTGDVERFGVPVYVVDTAGPATVYGDEGFAAVDLVAFPDGSSEPGSGKPGGYGVILCRVNGDGEPDFTSMIRVSGGVRGSGNNYMAEAVAVRVAIASVPENCNLTIYTDCLGLLQAVMKRVAVERAWLRAGARSVVRTIQALCAARSGRVHFHHVHSHTGADTLQARGNGMADEVAKGAWRRANEPGAARLPYLLTNELQFVFWMNNRTHVTGDIRKRIKRDMRVNLYKSWASKATQGAAAKSAGQSETLTRCDKIRKTLDPRQWWLFLHTMCRWMPTADRDPGGWKNRVRPECPRCRRGHDDTTTGLFQCALADAHMEALRIAIDAKLEEVPAKWKTPLRERRMTPIETLVRGTLPEAVLGGMADSAPHVPPVLVRRLTSQMVAEWDRSRRQTHPPDVKAGTPAEYGPPDAATVTTAVYRAFERSMGGQPPHWKECKMLKAISEALQLSHVGNLEAAQYAQLGWGHLTGWYSASHEDADFGAIVVADALALPAALRRRWSLLLPCGREDTLAAVRSAMRAAKKCHTDLTRVAIVAPNGDAAHALSELSAEVKKDKRAAHLKLHTCGWHRHMIVVVDSIASHAHMPLDDIRALIYNGLPGTGAAWPPWKWRHGRRQVDHRDTGWGAALCWYDPALGPRWETREVHGVWARTPERKHWRKRVLRLQNYDAIAAMAGCVPSEIVSLAFGGTGDMSDDVREDYWKARSSFRDELADIAFGALRKVWDGRHRADQEVLAQVRRTRRGLLRKTVIGRVTWKPEYRRVGTAKRARGEADGGPRRLRRRQRR